MDLVATIQNSIEIASKLRALSKKVEDADFKMLVADLSNELADAKLEVANLKGALAEAKTKSLLDLQEQIDRLNRENASLRTQLDTKQYEIGSLNSQVKVLAERLNPTSDSKLDDTQEAILLLLAQHERLDEEELARLLDIGKQLASYHVEELRKRNFVHPDYLAGSAWTGEAARTEWFIQHAGREYLLRRQMLR